MARLLHFYPGYTRATLLAEPLAWLFALSAELPGIAAEEDLRALQIAGIAAHPGDRGQQLRQFGRHLLALAGGAPSSTSDLESVLTAPNVAIVRDGSLTDLHARLRARFGERDKK